MSPGPCGQGREAVHPQVVGEPAPRTELDALLAREELEKAGIYLLTGSDVRTGDPRLTLARQK